MVARIQKEKGRDPRESVEHAADLTALKKLSKRKGKTRRGGGPKGGCWHCGSSRALPRQGEKEKAERGIQGMPAHTMDLSWVAEVEKGDGADNGEEEGREPMRWKRRNQRRS